MFSWVCSRCGHEVPPSKTECPFCTPPAPEPVAPPPPQQYQAPQPVYTPPVPPQQAPPQQAPPQYAQQAPPQYWQPLGPPPPQQQYPPQYVQQAPPQYWQPQQYPPQQYPSQQYQPVQEQPPQQYQPPPQQEAPPQQQYQPPPPQYAPAPPQYTPPAPVAEYRQPEPVQSGPTPWMPEEQAGKPAWLVGTLAFVGVLVLLGIVYFVVSSHGSSSAKDAAKQQTTNPLQKYIEVVGVRIVGEKNGEVVKFLVVNHGATELTDLTANVTLWASTQRSEEDSVGTFTFRVDTLGSNDSKELSAPLKTDKGPAEMPDDWRNITADVQVSAAQ